MPARTVKGNVFTITIENKKIIVTHIPGKGKRCRVIVPDGAMVESRQTPFQQHKSINNGNRE